MYKNFFFHKNYYLTTILSKILELKFLKKNLLFLLLKISLCFKVILLIFFKEISLDNSTSNLYLFTKSLMKLLILSSLSFIGKSSDKEISFAPLNFNIEKFE